MRGLGMRAIAAAAMLVAAGARAGNLDSPAAPTSAASAMYTVEDLYDRLDTGAAGVKRTGAFTEPAAGPGSTGRTLDEVMSQAPVQDAANGASVSQVVSGKTFWGLRTKAGWSTLTGTMADNGAVAITPSSSAQSISAGYHNGSGSVAGDADLVSGNIRAGVNLFGVNGKAEVVDTATGTGATAAEVVAGKTAYVNGAAVTGTRPLSTLGKTGQATVYVVGDDGTYQKGVAPTGARFTNHGNGTVTDNLTGLMWGQSAHNGPMPWYNAVPFCEGYSLAGYSDWRLPNRFELESLLDLKNANPCLPSGHPFGLVPTYYWSSTSWAPDPNSFAWAVYLLDGSVSYGSKGNSNFVWPVRGGP